jgi:hypothetical protein
LCRKIKEVWEGVHGMLGVEVLVIQAHAKVRRLRRLCKPRIPGTEMSGNGWLSAGC